MMRIRPAQIEAFASPFAQQFESASIAHIERGFPKHFGFLQENGARRVIQHGRERAEAYGLVDATSTLLYIDLTLLLGRGFDHDIQMPWAGSILTDPSLGAPPALDVIQPQPLVKAVRLHEYAIAYLDAVSGLNNEFIDDAQRALLHEEPVVRSRTVGKEFEQEVLERLRGVWPQKYHYIGDAVARELIRAGVEKMRRYGITTPTGAMFGIAAMYMLGASFDEDPLFSWATDALNERERDEVERTQLFYLNAMAYLKSWCALC